MSLIPFILDLAEELHDFNFSRSSLGLGLGMDIDDVSFGMYPLEQLAAATAATQHSPSSSQHPQLSPSNSVRRNSRLAHAHSSPSSVLWVPIKGGQSQVQQRHHPYSRVAGAKTVCCNKSLLDLEKELGDKVNSASNASASAAGSTTTKSCSAYSVVNRNGFQVSMNVKQFAPHELTVKTIDNCIVVEGQHDEKEDGHGVISRHFIRKYMLPKGFDPTDVHSTLSSDGILTVKAPPPPPPVIKAGEERPVERIVDIQQQSVKSQSQSPLSSLLQSKDVQMPIQKSAVNEAEQPTPKSAATVSVNSEQKSAEERNGNGEPATEVDVNVSVKVSGVNVDVNANANAAETADETANAKTKEKETEPVVQTSSSTSISISNANSISTSSSNSSVNNGEQKPISEPKPVEKDTAEKTDAEKEKSTDAAISSDTVSIDPEPKASEAKIEDSNANGNLTSSNNNSNADKAAIEEEEGMPVAKKAKTETDEQPVDQEKVEKPMKGPEEIAAVDAAILLAKNQANENGATAAKSEEPALATAN